MKKILGFLLFTIILLSVSCQEDEIPKINSENEDLAIVSYLVSNSTKSFNNARKYDTALIEGRKIDKKTYS